MEPTTLGLLGEGPREEGALSPCWAACRVRGVYRDALKVNRRLSVPPSTGHDGELPAQGKVLQGQPAMAAEED